MLTQDDGSEGRLAEVQTLADLIGSADGLSFLESKGVYVDQNRFKDRLEAPARPDLADQLGLKETKLVCSGQQIYVDYHQSVLSKIEILREIERDGALFPFFLWVDTDRSGSDSLMTKFSWPSPSKKGPISILPPGTREVEERFAKIDPVQLSSAIDKLETYLRQSNVKLEGAKDKFLRLRDFFLDGHGAMLSAFNLELTDFLLCQVLGYAPRSVVLSDQLGEPFLLEAVETFLNHLADVVSVFNQARESLAHAGIDPQVRPLDEDYLPLFYSCNADDRRLRLHHSIEGGDHYAVAECHCGRSYRFHLGEETLSVAEIARTGRWSPDVCFPIFFNDLVSGFVAGKSSGIYLLILNEVLRKVLDRQPVPILVPQSLRKDGDDPARIDSLIYRYFTE